MPCSKCKPKNKHFDHTSASCKEPYLFHTEQACDRCLGSSHPTGDDKCPRPPMGAACKTCGHENDHKTNECPIKDYKIESNLNQYTKPRYDFYVLELQKGSKQSPASKVGHPNVGRSGGKQGTSASLTGRPKVGGGGQSSRSSDPSRTVSRGNRSRPQFKAVKDRHLPPPTEAQKRKEKWAKWNLKLEAFQADTTANNNVQITTNFFPIRIDDEHKIRKYRIVLGKIGDRDIKKREAKEALIRDILNDSPPSARVWVSDYCSHIISVGQSLYNFMTDEKNAAWSIVHDRPDNNGTFSKLDSTIFFEGMLNWEGLRAYLDPSVDRDENYHPDEDFRMLNLLSWMKIYQAPSQSRVRTIGNKFYPEDDSMWAGDLGAGLVPIAYVRRGFFSSVRPGNGQLLLNVNNVTSAFYPRRNLDVYIRRRSGGDHSPSDRLKKELQNLRVRFFDDDPPKARVILGFADNVSGTYNFSFNGEERSVMEHMRSEYQTPLDQLNESAACVIVGKLPEGRGDIVYPADRLEIMEWQPFHGKMDSSMTTDMLGFASKSPHQNQILILNKARSPLGIPLDDQQQSQNTSIYAKFGLHVGHDLLIISSRYLRAPIIEFSRLHKGGGRSPFTLDIRAESQFTKFVTGKLKVKPNGKKLGEPRDTASWNLTQVSTTGSVTFYNPAPRSLTRRLWIINLTGHAPVPEQFGLFGKQELFEKTKKSTVKRFFARFSAASKSYCLAGIEDPYHVDMVVPGGANMKDRREKLAAALTNEYRKFGSSPAMVIIALSKKDTDIHADIKWWSDCKMGISTLCVSWPKFEKERDDNLMGNLMLKYNYRLGGVTHRINGNLGTRPHTMIIGADVTHSGDCIDKTCPSMAGVVATCDDIAMTYLASARLQPKDTEHIGELREMVIERLQCYRRNNNRLPRHILFYRDGVSETQYGMVRETELNRIEDACAAELRKGETKPLITLVIVAKRHHGRFYRSNPTRETEGFNLQAGLVVDQTVVAPKQFNFYLQAHDAPIGTAHNAHYVVLTNESNYTASELQELTNKLSFMGSKATKGLSTCVPARYADTICDRLRKYMRPALESKYAGPDWEVNNYRRDPVVWGAPMTGVNGSPGRTNPWHPNLNDRMFWL